MKITCIPIILVLNCLVPSSFLAAQNLELEWFPKQKKGGFSYSTTYLQGAGEQIYAFYETTSGLGPHNHSVARLNGKLQTEATESLNKDDAGPYSRVMSVSVGEGFLVAFAYHYDDNRQEAIFSRSILSTETLKPIQPFQSVKIVGEVDWNSHEPSMYPVVWSLSPNGEMMVVRAFRDQASGNPESIWFVMNMEGEILMEEELTKTQFRGQFHLSNSGILHSVGSDGVEEPSRVYSQNIHTGESHQLTALPETESLYRIQEDQHQRPYYLSFQENDKGLDLVLFAPGVMEAPLVAYIPEDQLDLMASKKERKSGLWPKIEQVVLDIYQTNNGSYIVTTEYRSRDIVSNMFIGKNIVSICLDQSGSVQWIRCIPKAQEEYRADNISALVFHSEEGIHLLYNEGSKNLTLSPGDKPKGFGNAGSGDDIIALATITEEGKLTREVFYDLAKDKMWLNVADSGLVSDDLLILRLTMRQNEILGKLRILN